MRTTAILLAAIGLLLSTSGQTKPPATTGAQRAANFKDLAPRTKKDADKLKGVRVSGAVVAATPQVNPDNAAEFTIFGIDHSIQIGGQPMRAIPGCFLQVRCCFKVDESDALSIARGDRFNIAGDVEEVRYLTGIDLVNAGRKGKDRILELELTNISRN